MYVFVVCLPRVSSKDYIVPENLTVPESCLKKILSSLVKGTGMLFVVYNRKREALC